MTTQRICRECHSTGQCSLCRGTGGSGWSGSRTMLKNRCPQCFGTGICHTCKGTGDMGHW